MSDEAPLLIDPDRARLAAALAVLAEGSRTGAYLDHLEQQMAERVTGTTARPLGSRQRQVMEASWWTDHQGRRHVRLRSPSREGEASPWNPLGRVHPGVLFKVERGGEERWVAVCRCGEAGPPELLAWMGPWCGPCHDRAEEDAPLREPYPAVQSLPAAASWLAWRAGGASLFASTSGFDTARLDLVEGRWKPSDDWKSVTTWTRNSLVPSPADPGLVACYDTDRRQIRLLDERAGLRQVLPIGREASQPPSLAFSADGQALAFAGGTAGWRLFRKSGAGFELALRLDSFASEVAFSPDGKMIALRGHDGGEVRLANAATGMTEVNFVAHGGARLAGFALGGTRLVMIGWAYEEHAQAWSLSPPAKACQFRLRAAVEARVTPCGRFLVWRTGPSGGNALRLSCLATGELLAMASADPVAAVSALAFSPDGGWLAMSDSQGKLRVVRWPALLAEMLAGEAKAMNP